jgi:hypothetical protein
MALTVLVKFGAVPDLPRNPDGSVSKPAQMSCGPGPPHLLGRRASRSGTFRVASSIQMARTGTSLHLRSRSAIRRSYNGVKNETGRMPGCVAGGCVVLKALERARSVSVLWRLGKQHESRQTQACRARLPPLPNLDLTVASSRRLDYHAVVRRRRGNMRMDDQRKQWELRP